VKHEIDPVLLKLVRGCLTCVHHDLSADDEPCSNCFVVEKYEPNEDVLDINDLLVERDVLEDELREAKSQLGAWRDFVENNRNRRWKP
jgi:hypothetical protein